MATWKKGTRNKLYSFLLKWSAIFKACMIFITSVQACRNTGTALQHKDGLFICMHIHMLVHTHTSMHTVSKFFKVSFRKDFFFSTVSYLVRYHSTYLGLNSDLWRALQVLLWCTVKKLSCADSVAFNNSGSVPSEPSNPFKEIIHPGTHKTPDSVDLNATESS